MAKIIQFSDFEKENDLDEQIIKLAREEFKNQMLLENTKDLVGIKERMQLQCDCANHLEDLFRNKENSTKGEIIEFGLSEYHKTCGQLICDMEKLSISDVSEFISKISPASVIEFVPMDLENHFYLNLSFNDVAVFVDKESDDER